MKSIVQYLMVLVATSCSSIDFQKMNEMVAYIQLDLETTLDLYESAIKERKEGIDAEIVKQKYKPQITKIRKEVVDRISEFNSYCKKNNVPEEIYQEYSSHINTKEIAAKATELDLLGVSIELEE